MTADRCYQCDRSLGLVPDDAVERSRESLGFGHENNRWRYFCSIRCKARWLDVDPVLETTKQATIAAFDGSARDAADRIAWGVR